MRNILDEVNDGFKLLQEIGAEITKKLEQCNKLLELAGTVIASASLLLETCCGDDDDEPVLR
jgi:hypothetical protein